MTGSSSPNRVQDARKAKSSPTGILRFVPQPRGSSYRLPPVAGGFCSSRRFSACVSSSQQGSGFSGPIMSNLLCGPSVSTHQGFPLQQAGVLTRTKTRLGMALLRGPARTEMSSGSHRTPHQHSIPPTAHQSQPAGLKQLQQEVGKQWNGKGIR